MPQEKYIQVVKRSNKNHYNNDLSLYTFSGGWFYEQNYVYGSLPKTVLRLCRTPRDLSSPPAARPVL